jgi:serine/threonine-protein kinase
MAVDADVRSPVRPGDIVGGKYRVDRIVGAGGMGVVVAATHTELDQPVALKFISPEALSGKDAVERFMREARVIAKLKSEHVARVYDVGRDAQNNPYMVLELLEGVDLANLAKQKGPLTVADSVELVLQVCEALVEAHAAGIVHRDLKPQNIFVTRRLNGMPLVKVLDFGIAKTFGPAAVGQIAITDSQAVIGSPLYMAPEHMRSARAADVRSDIWSLGVILYELLGGQVPFYGETVTEVCIRVVNEAPPSLLALRPGLDPALASIVMRCLEKDPNARWQNVAQLAMALEPFSRSAQHGGALRPWRSFEDTMDANPIKQGARVRRLLRRGIANTIPSDPMGEHVKAAVAGPGGAAARPSAPPRLVSTDTAWGRERATNGAKRSPAFSVGLVVGVLASAAAAAGLLVVSRGRGVTAGTTTDTTTMATVAAATSPPPAPFGSEVAQAPATVDATVSPAALPNAPSTSTPPPTTRPRVPSTGRARSDHAKAPSTSTSSSTATAAAASTTAARLADPPAPNGAPILR